LDPHDLAIAKYVAGRHKDIVFNHELAARRIVSKERLLELLGMTPVGAVERERVRVMIERDFAQ
jgi:hypothetical protein